MSDKNDLIIPEEIKQTWDEIEPILDSGNTILQIFNSCGMICKKIPIAGDTINFILVWDEEKSVIKAIANLGIDRVADLTIIFSIFMDLGMALDKIKDIENSRKEAKKFTFNLIDSLAHNKTYKPTAHTLYPYYKNIQESFAPLCLIDNKNSNLLKEFNFDDFSCSFYSNSIFNQSLKHLNLMQDEKDYINEYKMFLEKLKQFSQKYNHYKIMPIQLINNLKIAYIQKLSLEDINNININSKLHLLKALYLCEDYVLFDKNKQALFNEEKIKELDFNSSFYIIFSLHKDKITDTYLKARKRLYKSIDTFKKLGFKDLENAYEVYINSLAINEDKTTNQIKDEEFNKDEKLNKENNINNTIKNPNFKDDISLTLKQENNANKQEFNLLSSHSKSLNLFILENKDKSKRIIFLDNASSMSNLIHLYDNHCDIFLKNKSLLDIKRIEKECEIDFKALNTKVFFYETLLLGATESHQFLFEDKEENLLYHFKYDKENLSALGDLNIRYHHYNAKIKHYSLLEESLSIKLKPKEIQKEILYNDQSFNKLSKEVSTTSPSSPKEPSFITLILQDEWGKAIANAKVIIKGFRYDESLSVVKLKRKSDTLGKIRFDKEKYFRDCYSFKVKLEDNEAYLSTPLQNAKRIFNNYVSHKEGLILKFKAKEHLVYDGFNVYYYKGRDLITSYLARSGTAKADNIKQSDKQIAHYFYQDEKDKSKGKKAYFYYDDASIKDQFGTLPEGKYYFKINEIAKDLNPSFLKDYPFEIGRTWGKYCVRLYTDKECSKTSKEIKDKDKEQTIIKDNLYLYSVNEKAEFGSSGSIGMAQGELLELFHHQSRFVEDEREGVVCTEVSYPKKETKKIVFANENIDLNTSFAPGTYIKLQLEEKEISEELTWAYIHCESETKKESFLNGAYIIKTDELEILKCNIIDKTSAFHLPISRNNEPVEETKDYKYYIIVFAYDAKKKSVPNEEDAYIIIDMSFRVGVGSDDGVRESVLSSGLKSDTDFTAEWKKLNLIADFYDAYNFITLSLLSIQAINSLEKLKNYPQLSGKIVYIYHRFNAVKIYHQIKSKSDMQIKYKNYFQDINDYESKVIKVLKEFQYKADEIYPIKWWGNLTRKICENFNLNINIQTISGDYDGAYDTKTLTISLNQKDAKKTKVMLKTIIHEIRHAYMHQKELKNDALQRYIYYTYLYVYFDKNKNKEYFGTDKDETKNVYFFQPSESEARAIENDIIKEMQ